MTKIENRKGFLFVLVFVIVLIHFLKDIIQDVLRISTPLDLLGDIKENLNSFPIWVRSLWFVVSMGSFFVELFLLFLIPVVLRKPSSRLIKLTVVLILVLGLYFGVAVLLPR